MLRQTLVLALVASAVQGFVTRPTVAPKKAAQRSTVSAPSMNLFNTLFGPKQFPAPCIMGDEEIMSKKAHGTSATPVQPGLRWDCDRQTADQICNFNRHFAEPAGYFLRATSFLADNNVLVNGKPRPETAGPPPKVDFYDSNTGKLLFTAPKGRSWEQFCAESDSHGWPSFRDEEVNWDYVRCLGNGEAVSVDGTHLGHNLPDRSGNRYCINLVSVAGNPAEESAE